MKKINLNKTVILLFAVFALSNCEENGPIQFIVIDDFSTTIPIKGLAGESSYSIESSTNISELLDNADTFVEADVESVTLELMDDFSGNSIDGNLSVSAGLIPFLNEDLSLTKSPSLIIIPDNVSNILTLITSGAFPISITGNTSSPLGDDDFTIKLTFKIKAKVE